MPIYKVDSSFGMLKVDCGNCRAPFATIETDQRFCQETGDHDFVVRLTCMRCGHHVAEEHDTLVLTNREALLQYAGYVYHNEFPDDMKGTASPR